MPRTILVFGASGTVGQGFIKICLDKGGIKVVGVFRSEESARKVRTRLGDPPAYQFVTVVGNFDSDQSAEELQKTIVAKVGAITDVVASVGGGSFKGPLLQFSLEELRKEVITGKIEPHFLIAKHFLPLIQDKQGTSYTFINGGAAYHPVPNMGHLTLANGAEMKLAQVVMEELKDKPVRINEFVISCYVLPWDEAALPPAIASMNFPHSENLKVGNALLGVIVHPNAKGESMKVEPKDLEKLTQTGTL